MRHYLNLNKENIIYKNRNLILSLLTKDFYIPLECSFAFENLKNLKDKKTIYFSIKFFYILKEKRNKRLILPFIYKKYKIEVNNK